jgi:preprotein translocase subunit SecA
MGSLLKQLVDSNERQVARLRPIVARTNALEAEIEPLSDQALAAKGPQFRERLANGEALDDLLPEVYAVVREVARRTVGMRPFDVQIMGAIVLHQGKIAEMRTGEGKTLVATMPICLNAFTGKGVHLATHNDYLAKRDREWMGPIYEFLGLTVGLLQQTEKNPARRREAYAADITYGTYSEFGFDYLRDNMAISLQEVVQRGLNYCIVDEVDSLLIDEARVPLLIAGEAAKPTDLYAKVDRVVASLTRERDYTVDEKIKTAMLTEEGQTNVERALGLENLSDPDNLEIAHHVNAALRGRYCYKRDVDYLVKDGEVVIVDEFTGRTLPGRTWAEGLHQAIEAKERVPIREESQTLATITYQNYFRLYQKLSGMTGTAKTEEGEFVKIYGMPVVVIPPYKPIIRRDFPDVVQKTEESKLRSIALEIASVHATGRPILVGTRSIEVSERLSARLAPQPLQMAALAIALQKRLRTANGVSNEDKQKYFEIFARPADTLTLAQLKPIARAAGLPADPMADEVVELVYSPSAQDGKSFQAVKRVLSEGVAHNVLNAKYHDKEAAIIAYAGRLGAVTIATNMAGRGVDIILGGPPDAERTEEERQREAEQVKRLGGLHIIGTERHEARRIDNQLRGRSGRLGDPGASRFYLSLEDELMRLFAPERLRFLYNAWPEEEPLTYRIISRRIEGAQKKVEAHNFEMRRNTLRYDDVMDNQRSLIYRERRKVLEKADLSETFRDMREKLVHEKLRRYADKELHPDDWDLGQVLTELGKVFPIEAYVTREQMAECRKHEELEALLVDALHRAYADRETALGAENVRQIERVVLLRVVDTRWVDHLEAMDFLREGIGLRAYAQIDPIVAYHKEAFNAFDQLLAGVREEAISMMFRVQIAKETVRSAYRVRSEGTGTLEGQGPQEPKPVTTVRKGPKVGRNDPCPCGSGKKYKRCCMQKEQAARV